MQPAEHLLQKLTLKRRRSNDPATEGQSEPTQAQVDAFDAALPGFTSYAVPTSTGFW